MDKNACPSTDMNFLSPNGFLLQIERLPLVSFFSQSVQLPSVTLGNLEQPSPLARIKIPGDIMDFQPLQVPFMVDEKMNNYMEAFKWMVGLTFPENYKQYVIENNSRGFKDSSELPRNYSDAKLFVLNSHNNVIRTFTFVDCFPVSLEGIAFDTKNMDVPYVSSSLSLEYTYFSVE